jgi:hypothetical protein
MMGMGLALPLACGGFTPLDLGGVFLWLRSDLGITLNGSTVSAWADQSGAGNNATQSNGSQQPTYSASDASYNGRPSLSFTNGSATSLATAAFAKAQPHWGAVVGEMDAAAQTGGFVDAAVVAHGGVIYGSSTNKYASAYAGSTLISTTAVGSKSAIIVNFNLTTSVYVNASASAAVSGSAGTEAIDGLAIGGANNEVHYLTGKVLEVVYGTGNLTTAQISQLLQYFGAIYGGSWS